MTYRAARVIAIVMMTLAIAGGCRSEGDSHGEDGHSTRASSGTGSSGSMMMMPRNDKDLVTMLLEHHEGAIRLSNMELRQGESDETKRLAQKIKDTQEKEKQDLERLQQQVGGAGMSLSSDMKAKQARAEQEVSAARGHEVDHAFIKHMTELTGTASR